MESTCLQCTEWRSGRFRIQSSLMKSALTPLDFLARSAFVYRDKIAVVDGERRFAYSEFNRRIHRLASALIRIGIEPGDRVAVLAPNTPLALEPHFAVDRKSVV